ncbi:MAG: oligosaccharide flippase family protein [Verrucomicrobia bacterium]|nr:oligosaccharide flippase family protein [Verrucomicrobiota bacterium]
MTAPENRGSTGMAAQAWASIGLVTLAMILAPVRVAILTRTLSKADYGLFSLLSVLAASLGFMGMLGLRQYLLYTVPGKSPMEQGRFFQSCLRVTLIASVAIAGLFIVLCRWSSVMAASFSLRIIGLASLYIVLYALASLGLGYMLAAGDVVRYRAVNVLMANFWILLLLMALLFRRVGLAGLMWAWLIGLLLPVGLIGWIVRARLGEGFHARPARECMWAGLRYGVPLLPRYFALALFKLADRFVILQVNGPEAVALYTVAANLAFMAADTQVFLEFIFPYLSAAWSRNRAENRAGLSGEALDHFHAGLRWSLTTTLPMALGLVLWGRPVVALVAGRAYGPASAIFPMLAPVIVLIPVTSFFQLALNLDGKTMGVGATILAAAGLNLLLNLWWIPTYGVIGAAGATSTATVLLFAATLLMSNISSRLSLKAVRLPGALGATVAVAGVTLLLRHVLGRATPWEWLAAPPVFLAAGWLAGLWHVSEVRGWLARHQ